MTEVIALNSVAKRLVEVAFVKVPFVIFAPTIVPFANENVPLEYIFVTVALVPVASTQVIFPPETAIGVYTPPFVDTSHCWVFEL